MLSTSDAQALRIMGAGIDLRTGSAVKRRPKLTVRSAPVSISHLLLFHAQNPRWSFVLGALKNLFFLSLINYFMRKYIFLIYLFTYLINYLFICVVWMFIYLFICMDCLIIFIYLFTYLFGLIVYLSIYLFAWIVLLFIYLLCHYI